MRVLITSGGTKIPIDPVRNITNMSNGTFGSKIATEFLKLGHEVCFITAKRGKTPFTLNTHCYKEDREELLSKVNEMMDFRDKIYDQKTYSECQFDTFEEYHDQLFYQIGYFNPEIIILAAAVSDYTTIPSDTKIKSDYDLTIKLKPTEKIISLIRNFCPKAYLVGFKLLVDSSDFDLYKASCKSIEENDCNLVVANEWYKYKSGNHEVMIVKPELRCEPSFSIYNTNQAVAVVNTILENV